MPHKVESLMAENVKVPNDGDFYMAGKPLKAAGGLHWDQVNSRLGVGTNTPSDKLHVTGRATIGNSYVGTWGANSAYTAFQHTSLSSGSSATYALLQSSIGATYINSVSNQPINFRENNADKMVLTGGNLGIGTVSPSYKLDVNGTVNTGALTATSGAFSGNLTLNLIDNAPTIRFDSSESIFRQSSDWVSYFTARETSIERYADKQVYASGTGAILDTTHRINFGYSDTYINNLGYYPAYHEMHFDVMNHTDTNDATLDRIMTLRGDGNVGIGVTDPVTKLELGSTFTTYTTQNMISFRNKQTNYYEWQIGPSIVGGSAAFLIRGGADGYGGLSNIFNIVNTSVGIGTVSPGYKLDVDGTVNTGALTATSVTVPNDGDFVMNEKTLKAATGLHWDRVNSRLGVGTDTPGYKLDVAGTGNFSGLLTAPGGIRSYKDGVVAEFQPATSGSYTLINFNSKVNSGSDRGFILVQDETANSPGTRTEDLRMTIGVHNDFRQSGSHSDELWFQGGGRLVYNVGSWDSELNTIIGTPGAGTTGGHEWRVNNSAKMVIEHTGDVGIGTTNPAYKLDVHGTSNVGALTATTGNFSGDLTVTGNIYNYNYTEVDINAPATVSGTWTTATSSSWGDIKFNNAYDRYRWNDAPGYVEYTIPTGMKSAYLSQLTWNSGGYVDIHGVQADGGLVFLRRINTRQAVENSNEGNPDQHDGTTITFIGTGLQLFSKIRLTNNSGRFHLSGLAFTPNENEGTEGVGMVHSAQISDLGSGIPTPTGTGASGSWGISITGNAATATTATNQSGGTVSATTGTFSGNVGIGTASPQCKLHVSGAICLESEDLGLFGADSISDSGNRTKTYIKFAHGGTSNDWAYLRQIGASNGNHIALDFHDDGDDAGFSIRDVKSTDNPDTVTTRFIVERGGNVGIGTNDPGYKLVVAGDIYATGSIIGANGNFGALGAVRCTEIGRPSANAAGFRFSDALNIPFIYPAKYSSGNITPIDNQLFFGYTNYRVAAGYFQNLYRNAESTFSDDRIKTGESLITNATETLLKLKPQTYDKHTFTYDEITDEEYSNVNADGLIYDKTVETWVDRSEYKRNTLATKETHPWIRRTLSKDTRKEAGLIAQDIWYDVPELKYIVNIADDASPVEEKPVSETDDIQQDPDYDAAGWGTTEASVSYTDLISYLIKSIQELHERIKVLENPTN